MPELRTKIPKKIGVLLSAESIWEVVFSFYQIENNNYLRMAVEFTSESSPSPEDDRPPEQLLKESIYQNLSGIDIKNTVDLKPGSLQAFILTVGETEFNSLCNFEEKGGAFGVNHDLRTFLRAIYRGGMPIGAFGYAVPLLVKSIQGITDAGPVVTVGNDPKLHSGIEAAGGQAITTRPTEVIIDHDNKLVTSGGQLASNRFIEVAADCENMFIALLELIKG